MSDNFERQIKNSMDALMFSPEEKERIKNRIMEQNHAKTESEDKTIMKKWSLGKAVAAAAIVLAASGGVVYAASVISRTEVSVTDSDYKYTYDSSDKMLKEAGIDASLPESFSTGYTFDEGAVLKVEGIDDTGAAVKSWPEVTVNYINGDKNIIYLSIEDASCEPKDIAEHTESREIDGITVNFDLDEFVSLPPSAEETGLSSEMQERVDNDPHFFVNYGSEKEEHSMFSNISFVKNGVYYLLSGQDTKLSADDFFTMCSELIDMN